MLNLGLWPGTGSLNAFWTTSCHFKRRENEFHAVTRSVASWQLHLAGRPGAHDLMALQLIVSQAPSPALLSCCCWTPRTTFCRLSCCVSISINMHYQHLCIRAVDAVLQSSQDGPIDAPKTVQEVRQEPYPLPERCVLTHTFPYTYVGASNSNAAAVQCAHLAWLFLLLRS